MVQKREDFAVSCSFQHEFSRIQNYSVQQLRHKVGVVQFSVQDQVITKGYENCGFCYAFTAEDVTRGRTLIYIL